MSLQLLLTKLFIPKITDKHIKRERLLKKLVTGFHTDSQFTLVCAPAGYGKTTIVLEFLHSVNAASAWISLDEGDNDTQRFLAYLVAALKKAGVAIGKDIDSLVTDIGFNTTETILTMLVNCIVACADKKILVLDDYHIIRSQKINDIVKFLLELQLPNLHLVIVSREDPQIPLARLRMKGKLTELRMDDLLFSCEEATELFDKSVDVKLSSEAVEKMTLRTEGWIAGLQLAGLLLTGYREEQVEDYINKFDGTSSYIIDYLVEEVLIHQTPEIRDFLCRTSVLERMNGELCDELTGRSDGRQILHRIEKTNLFLVPLDDKREWYRYHHLFADSLKTSLASEEEKGLYKKAAIWMKNNGYFQEAIRYAFKSRDIQLALKMVEDGVIETFQNAQLDSLVKWLEQLPEDMVKGSELLSVRKAIAYLVTGRTDKAIQYVSSLDDEFERNASMQNKGLLYTARAMIAGISRQDAEEPAQKALEFLQPWDPIARTSALNTLGRAQYRKGKIQDAAATFKSAYESGMKIGYQFITALSLMHYSSCLHALERSSEALVLCNQYIEGLHKQFDKLPPYVGVLYYAMSRFYSVINEPEKALWYKEEGSVLCKGISYDIEASLSLFTLYGLKEESSNVPKTLTPGNSINKRKEETLLEYGDKLSEREIEILELLGKGFSNREIAQSLFITINTTQWHISHIFGKLGVKSRTQAILKAKESGIL